MVKKLTIGAISGGLLVAGGVAAFTLLNKTPKEEYFIAEYDTMQSTIDFIENRYELEYSWQDKAQKETIQSDYELSAIIEDDYRALDYGVAEAINSSALNVTTLTDTKNAKYALTVGANILGYDLDEVSLFLSKDNVMLDLPFQEEALEAKTDGLVNWLETMTGEDMCLQDFDISKYIENKGALNNEEMKKLAEKYGKEIYDSISKDAFLKDDNMIKLDLSGDDVKTIMLTVLKKAEQDKELQKMLDELLLLNQPCENYTGKALIADMMEELEDLTISSGIISKIWIEDNLITKRSIEIDGIKLTGTQTIAKDEISWNYDINTADGEPATFTGTLGSGKQYKDEIEFLAYGTEINYDATESGSKKTREFERSFNYFTDWDSLVINWNGENTYSGDRVSGEHEVVGYTSELGELGEIGINIKTNSVIAKKIKMPAQTVDLTKMSRDEMENYFTNELLPNAEDWGLGFVQELEDLLYY